MTILEAITLGIALLGAVLGVVNTWQSLDRTRVKLKVVPAHAIPFGAVDPRLKFSVEVTNLSDFPVTIREVGVFYKGTDKRGVIIPVLPDGGPWPRRLESRSSVSVYSHLPESPSGHRIECAYAKTECGYVKRGSSGALKQIAAGMEL